MRKLALLPSFILSSILPYLTAVGIWSVTCSQCFGEERPARPEIEELLARLDNKQDPIRNLEEYLTFFDKAEKFSSAEDLDGYWEWVGDRVGWILVYLAENGSMTEEIDRLLQRTSGVLSGRTIPYYIRFGKHRKRLIDQMAHMKPGGMINGGLGDPQNIDFLVHDVREELLRRQGLENLKHPVPNQNQARQNKSE